MNELNVSFLGVVRRKYNMSSHRFMSSETSITLVSASSMHWEGRRVRRGACVKSSVKDGAATPWQLPCMHVAAHKDA